MVLLKTAHGQEENSMDAIYTLKLSNEGQNIVTRSGNNLARLTTCLFSLLEHNISDAVGEIIHNETGTIVKKHSKTKQ